MRNASVGFAIVLLTVALVAMTASGADKSPDWSVNATIIEACSCPMFCQCYFNAEPASHASHGGHGEHGEHGGDHFCKFNMGFKINRGHHGETKLDGATFWIGGDLGADFADGKMDWSVLTFDKKTTAAQREGIAAFIGTVFPVEWESFSTAEGDIEWSAGDGTAHARLDGGKTAEVKLAATKNAARKGTPVVIHNLQYWNAEKNDGFILMPNEVEAWRTGDKAFEYKGSNGFMITIEADSKWAAKTAG